MRKRLTALAGLGLLVLVGCTTDPEPDPEPAPQTGDDQGAASGDTGQMGAVAVAVAMTDLGEVIVDGAGLTLYMFDPDAQGESTCYDDCATNWPPLTVEGDATAGEGADDALLGVVERDDGTMQVTYNGWPLYYFYQDAAAGDVNGQAVNGIWWVLDPSGEPIRE